jgi:hypothetical protein
LSSANIVSSQIINVSGGVGSLRQAKRVNKKLVLKNLTNKRNGLYCELSKINKKNSKLRE